MRDICFYFLRFEKRICQSETIAEKFPAHHIIKNDALLEIYSEKKDHDKCLEIACDMCDYESGRYLRSLWMRARSISIFGNVRKQEAIAAWYDLLTAAKHNNKVFENRTTLWWVLESLGRLSNDYIAISEFDKTFETIDEYTSFAIEAYNELKEKGTYKRDELDTIRGEIQYNLGSCYWWCFPTEDNLIANDPRYKKYQERLAELD